MPRRGCRRRATSFGAAGRSRSPTPGRGSRDSAGDTVRSQVVDHVCRKAEGAVDRIVGLGVAMALAAEPRLARVPPFCVSIDEAVHRDCERVRPKLRARFASLFDAPPRPAGELCLERVRLPLRLVAGRARVLSRRVRPAAPNRGALRAVADRQERVVDASPQACVLAGGAAAADPPGRERPAARGRRTRRRLPGRVVGLRLEGRAGAALDDRAARADHRAHDRGCARPADPPLHDRDPHAGALHRPGRRLSRRAGRDRRAVAAAVALGGVGGGGGRSTARRRPDGTRKRYFLQVPANMRTAREAVAWTYGLPEARYRPTVRT